MDFLLSLASKSPVLNETLDRCFLRWRPEEPPITVAFGELGHAVGEHFHDLPIETQQKIFAQIEEGMVSSDEGLATAVATGLIEALVTESDRRTELWSQFEKLLGPESLKHAVCWRDYGS